MSGKGVSIGLGGITTTIDVRDRIPVLLAQLDDKTAKHFQPSSRHDEAHDNAGVLDKVLANVNRGANIALNGGQIAPLRIELGRWQGKTYYLGVDAHFVDPPTYSGIEHVDKLATKDSLSTAGTTSKSSGSAFANVRAIARSGVGLGSRPDPAAASQKTGHGAATGHLATGGTADVALSSRDDTRTTGVGQDHSQSSETSGPMAAYSGRIALDLRIERGFGLDQDGHETAREVLARDSKAVRDSDAAEAPRGVVPRAVPVAGNGSGRAAPSRGRRTTRTPARSRRRSWTSGVRNRATSR